MKSGNEASLNTAVVLSLQYAAVPAAQQTAMTGTTSEPSALPSVTAVQCLVLTCILAVLACAYFLHRSGKVVATNGRSPKPHSIKVNSATPVQPGAAEDKRTVKILYGTQTGTAERFSKQLAVTLKQRCADASVVALNIENYKVALISSEQLLLFIMATYGDGEPTDDAAEFYNWLAAEASSISSGDKGAYLQRLSYGVFGLGNKQYEHFNAVGKAVHKNLAVLGARPIVRRGDGDDDDCIDDDFAEWCKELLSSLESSTLLGSTDGTSKPMDVGVPCYDVETLPSGTKEVVLFAKGKGSGPHDLCHAKVSVVKELHTVKSDRSCVHVELDISGSGAGYETGDHVAILAQNRPVTVDQTIRLLGWDPKTIILVRRSPDSPLSEPFPSPVSLKSAISCFADVLSTPHREVLHVLSAFASDASESAELARLAHGDGKHDYQERIAKQRKSLLEVLGEFPSVKPSYGAFFGSIAPRLQPRFYSISSSAMAHPETVHVTCAVVRDIMPTGRVHHGVCSSWLKHTLCNDSVPVYMRRSHFKLPQSAKVPVVMIGPGTGIAPFRGFLQERSALQQKGADLGPALLFFGCRSRMQDYIYAEELESFVRSNVLTKLFVAFSRDQSTKDYVQHHLVKNSAEVWELLQSGHVYVCGDAKHMAKDVQRALVAVVQTGLGCNESQAERYLMDMQHHGRYSRDVW